MDRFFFTLSISNYPRHLFTRSERAAAPVRKAGFASFQAPADSVRS
jgi:hypothetical protein